ncbi:MAG: tetratricopeptide repeat protein [Bacteroidales bacterium]|nr:tetratricopeptide repeat protein [Bacteroidales bacterium]MBN2821267.1 tetratricopeptide repeat protein [Bacteroidales bacterium]
MFRQKKYTEAIPFFEDAVRIKPEHYPANLGLVSCYVNKCAGNNDYCTEAVNHLNYIVQKYGMNYKLTELKILLDSKLE